MSKNDVVYEETNRLVKQAMQGDNDALGTLFEQEGRRILYFCFRLMGNMQQAEDAAQEVYIQVQKSIRSLKTPEAFTVWLNRIVAATCGRLKQQNQKHGSLLFEGEDWESISEEAPWMIPQQFVERSEESEKILEIIDNLPVGMKACVHLFYFEELPSAEIAKILGSSEKAVNSQLYRARQKLRFEIEKANFESADGRQAFSLSKLGPLLHEQAETLITNQQVEHLLKTVGMLQLPPAAGGITVASKIVGIATSAVAAVATTAVATIFLLGGHSGSSSLPTQPDGFNPAYSSNAVSSAPQRLQQPESRLEYTASIPMDGEAQSASSPAVSRGAQESLPIVNPVMPEVAPPPQADIELKGRVVIDTLAAEASGFLPPDETWMPEYFSRLFVELLFPDGQMVNTVPVDSQGRFAFLVPGQTIASGGAFTVRLGLPGELPFCFAGQTAGQDIQINLSGGKLPAEVEYHLGPQPTQFDIMLLETDGTPTDTNPQYAEILPDKHLPVQVEWNIKKAEGGDSVRAGSGTKISRQQLWGDAPEEGAYILSVQITDIQGNIAGKNALFKIAGASVQDGQ